MFYYHFITGSNLDSSSAKSSLPPIITLVHTLQQIKICQLWRSSGIEYDWCQIKMEGVYTLGSDQAYQALEAILMSKLQKGLNQMPFFG